MKNKDIYAIASRYAEFLVYHLGFEDAYLYSEVLHSNLMSKRDCVVESVKQSQLDFEFIKNYDCPKSK